MKNNPNATNLYALGRVAGKSKKLKGMQFNLNYSWCMRLNCLMNKALENNLFSVSPTIKAFKISLKDS